MTSKIKTNVPEIQFTQDGLVIPTEKDILTGVLKDLSEAFGTELNPSLETPQGQLASSLTAIIANKNNQLAWLINNLDPDYATDFMQDAIGKIYFLSRKGQVNSSVVLTLTGLTGTTIPANHEFIDNNSKSWFTQSAATIGLSGTVKVNATANGTYTAAANKITTIKNAIVGLDRVTNESDATEGTERESRQDFAERYKKSVSKNSVGTASTLYGNLGDLSGVSDLYIHENRTDGEITIGATSYKLSAHSVLVSIIGGQDKEIAKTILAYAGNGCDFNGNTAVTVTDDNFSDPKPEYKVSFLRPTSTPMYVKVTLRKINSSSTEYEAKSLIKEYIKGLAGSRIGRTIYADEIIVKLKAGLPNEKILAVELSLENGVQGKAYASFGVDQVVAMSDDYISIVEE